MTSVLYNHHNEMMRLFTVFKGWKNYTAGFGAFCVKILMPSQQLEKRDVFRKIFSKATAQDKTVYYIIFRSSQLAGARIGQTE